MHDLERLDRARKSLASGDFASVLGATEAPLATTAFAEERAALHAIAVCAVNRGPGARAESLTFRAMFPHSMHLARVHQACRREEHVTDLPLGGHPRQ